MVICIFYPNENGGGGARMGYVSCLKAQAFVTHESNLLLSIKVDPTLPLMVVM